MTTPNNKWDRVQRATAAVAARDALNARIARLCQPLPQKPQAAASAPTVFGLSSELSARVIAATEARATAPVVPPPAPVSSPKATRGSNLNDERRAEAFQALASVPQWQAGEKYPVDGRVDGGQWVV